MPQYTSVPYESAKIRKTPITPEQLLKTSHCYIEERFRKIIRTEGPVVDDFLQLRVLNSYGMKKRGCNIQPLLDMIMDTLDFDCTTQVDYLGQTHKVFWPEGVTPENYFTFRPASVRRDDITDYPHDELRNIFRYVLQEKPSLDGEELLRAVMDQLGFCRKGSAIDATLSFIASDLQ